MNEMERSNLLEAEGNGPEYKQSLNWVGGCGVRSKIAVTFFLFVLCVMLVQEYSVHQSLRRLRRPKDRTDAILDPTATYEHLKGRIDTTKNDLFFNHEEPPIIIRAKTDTANCVIMSCSEKGYKLLNISLEANRARARETRCDRVHFNVQTLTSTGERATGYWCRVALLRQSHKIFKWYRRLLYVDLDLLYDDKIHGFQPSKHQYGEFAISYKYEGRHTVLRDCWFVITNLHSWAMRQLVERWAGSHNKTPKFDDQDSFNELYRCKDVNCIAPKEARIVEKRHCGSWLKGEERVQCFNPRT